jgi:hypothetical protein
MILMMMIQGLMAAPAALASRLDVMVCVLTVR